MIVIFILHGFRMTILQVIDVLLILQSISIQIMVEIIVEFFSIGDPFANFSLVIEFHVSQVMFVLDFQLIDHGFLFTYGALKHLNQSYIRTFSF